MSTETQLDYKKLEQFASLELLAKQIVEGFIVGLHKSPFHGFSVEFSEHKVYNKGESTRHIDWKVYARTGRLYTKKYEEETNLRCQIILDTSSSMYFPDGDLNKMNFSVYAAAALIHLLRKQRDASGLTLFSNEIEQYIPAKSTPAHINRMYAELEGFLKRRQDKARTAVADALHKAAEIIHKRSMVVVFSDMFDNSDHAEELFSALQHLKYNKHEVILFHTLDHSRELNFDYKNVPTRFVDMESGQEVKAYPQEVREMYMKSISQYRKDIKLKCAQYEIDYVETDIQAGFGKILQEFLIKRSRMM